MTQKATNNPKQKEALVNEENDIFLSFLNKKIRNNRKKLEQIVELETRDTLKPEQVEKVKNKQNIIDNNKHFENCKELYYQALQSRKDEEKELQKVGGRSRKETKEDIVTENENTQAIKQVQTVQISQQNTHQPQEFIPDFKELSRKISLNILNLVHFAQFFRDQKRKNEFIEEFNQNKNSYEIDNLPDFDLFFEFYKKIFTFSESSAFEKLGDKISNSLNELQFYLSGCSDPALANKSYSCIFDTVQKITSSKFFLEKLADAKTQLSETNINTIGSELKPQKQIEYPVVHQEYNIENVYIREKSQPKILKEEEIEEKKEVVTLTEEIIKETPVQETKQVTKDWIELEEQEKDQKGKEPEAQQKQEKESSQSHQVQKENEFDKQKGKYSVDADGFITIERKKKQDDNRGQDQGPKKYGKKPFGGKPYNGQDKSRGDKPQGDRSQEVRPRGGRYQEDRPREYNPQADRPKGDRYYGDRQYTGGYKGGLGNNNKGNYEKKFAPKQEQVGETQV